MTRGPGAARRAVLLLVAAVLLAGCSTDVAFRVDDRLTITSPRDRSTVTLPLRISWRIRDFTGRYAVFVDRAPVPPGKTLAYLARNDRRCRAADGCPDAAYLAGLGVYTTSATGLVVPRLPRSTTDSTRRDRHRAVVVLLDASGRRVGESAFEVAFDVRRSGS